MASLPSLPRHRALLLCEDPIAVALLQSLLAALPRPTPEPVLPGAGESELVALAGSCNTCFIALGYAGKPAGLLVRRLLEAAPALRVFGVLCERNRHGDRGELLELVDAGAEEILRLEDLSSAALAALLRGPRCLTPSRPPSAGFPDGGIAGPAVCGAPLIDGRWTIELGAQQARFDDDTLRTLGYAGGLPGAAIAQWKALVHPADVDAVVTAIQQALDGTPPARIDYRLRQRDGRWRAVESLGIDVERDARGTPCAVEGRFRSPAASPATGPAQPSPAADLSAHSRTALLRYRCEIGGSFRVSAGNAAAATLLGVAPAGLIGLAANEAHPHYDGFEFSEALARVQHSGIAESRDALVLDRADPPTWHRLHFERLDGAEVLVEVSDISELVHARALRRIEDELAQFIVRSLPLTVLLVDESGRVLRCTSTAGNVFGNDRGALEEHDVQDLFGAAGPECLAQITHTLNTGRIGIATFAIDAERSQWLECRTTLLRARPGMPPRVLLGVLDASHREQAAREARLALEQLRAAIASVPQALYLKDVEGRYIATNAAFDALMGVEGGMLFGKTDVEVFPDELATELHEAAQRIALSGEALTERRSVGAGAARATRLCCDFPLRGADGALLGHGGLWMDPWVLPLEGSDAAARVLDLEAHRTARAADLDHATASVINRVEDALTDSGDYAGVLRQLEQLVETTMQAQALIHHAAGQGGPARPLVALAPLAREIVELERILVPASARFENEIDNELPPAHCEPVAFHQILLRGIRHARRSLGARGSLCIRLRRSGGARRACIACHEGFEGAFVELVIEDSDSRLDDEDIARLVSETGIAAGAGGALDDLAEIHALSHAQGGHLQIHRNVPAGISVHVFFRAGEPAEAGDTLGTRRSTIARFPLGRTLGRGGN